MSDLVIARRLLSLLESAVATSPSTRGEATVRSLREAIARVADRPLVVTLVGPSGTGKSALFNDAVGRPASPEGVKRPTTRRPVVAGAGNARGLVEDADLVEADLGGIVLVDLPPPEYEHEIVEPVVATSDLCLVVTSAARYADAATADTIALAEHYGVPATIIVDRVPVDMDPERVRQALVQRHGRRDIVVLPEWPGSFDGETTSIRELLERAAAQVDRVRRYRRDAAIEAAAAAALTIADDLDRAAGGAIARLAGIDRDLAHRSLPDALRPLIAEVAWPAAVDLMVTAIEQQVAAVLTGVTDEDVSVDEDAPHVIEAWRGGVDDAVAVSMRRLPFRRLARRKVADAMWRLAVDRDRQTSKPVTKWLGDRAEEVRAQAGADLDAMIRRMIEGAVAPTRDRLARQAAPPSREIRSVADELLREEDRTTVFRLTPDVAALRAAAEAGLPFEGPANQEARG